VRARAADKRKLAAAICVAALVIALFSAWRTENVHYERLFRLKARERALQSLGAEYVALKAETDEIGKRAALAPKEGGIARATEDILSSLGLRGRLATVKPLGTRQEGGLAVEEAEMAVKRVDMNEAVNILYAIERAPMMLSIKRMEARASFGAPALDMKLVIALARKK
jgi:hypothetical protein